MILAYIAAALIMLEPIRHVVMDHKDFFVAHGWDVSILAEYRANCDSDTPKCFALGGWLFTFGT
jgi:hypothetical protein